MISAIITNYNTWDLTLRCVKAINDIDKENYVNEIVIVDDSSTQLMPDYLKKHNKIKLIRNEANLGYAASVNVAFKNASNNICLLLDSDAYPIGNLCYIIERFKNEPDLGILGFHLVDEQNNNTGRGEAEPTFWSVLLGQQLEGKLSKINRSKEGYYTLYSCGIAVSKAVFEAVGGFDETFDFLEADNDFSMKVNRSKWHLSIDERVKIFHKGGGSHQLTSKRVIRYYRNRIKLLKKYEKYPADFLLTPLILGRLFIEWSVIFTIGRIKYEKEVFKDKLFSRSELMRLFASSKIHS
ncbi:MAG: glycosyl transferase family 2 [Mucilaginibacter sp.]|nr:glycosyl transferase family 2 [Mucilaginibacter sp.]